ncbi:hypothetical protein SAMN03097699_3091 [Flavobacteriaceae bacterium MAR_2010_188]|nr:hypothetical protein SAMN03097699_3091 [Flavobacteriaceae bacterium MAR_2010_188]
MKIQEKAPIIPPPVLEGPLQNISSEIQSWDNVVALTHWNYQERDKVDGADFYVGKKELGHIHMDGEIHLPTGKSLTKILFGRKLASPFRYGGGKWVMFNVKTAEDIKMAIELFRINYLRRKGSSIVEINRLSESRNS